MGDLYLIEVDEKWRPGRGRWWGPNQSGYTDDLLRAGLYTLVEASSIVKRSNRASMILATSVFRAEQETLTQAITEIQIKRERLQTARARLTGLLTGLKDV